MIITEMTKNECHIFLKQIKFGRLGCVRDKQPYVVPIYFVSDGKHLYGFSTLGQKIEWMRVNPRVCVEADDVINQLHWRSIVVFGNYQELPDTPAAVHIREYALELLQRRAVWWQPAYVASAHRGPGDVLTPIFYRIRIDEVSGHRASPDPVEERGLILSESLPEKGHGLVSRGKILNS